MPIPRRRWKTRFQTTALLLAMLKLKVTRITFFRNTCYLLYCLKQGLGIILHWSSCCECDHSPLVYNVYGKRSTLRAPTFTVEEILSTLLLLASFTMGVIRPPSVATATEISTEGNKWTSSPDHTALHCGRCYIR